MPLPILMGIMRSRCRELFRTASAVCVTGLILACSADNPASGQEIPGADPRRLNWPAASAPFEMDGVLRPPVPEQNAATDYLIALRHFSPEMEICFAASESRQIETRQAKQRSKMLRELILQRRADRSAVSMDAIATVLDEYEDGWDALIRAQQKPECMFLTGLSFQAMLPHLPAARQVSRVAVLRVELAVARGEIGTAIATIGQVLRLSRDLRPAGFQVSQQISMAMETEVFGRMLPRVLSASDLSVEDCDQLIRQTREHLQSGLDLLTTGYRMEYILVRTLYEDLLQKTGDFDRDEIRRSTGQSDLTVDDYIGQILFQDPQSDAARNYLLQIDQTTDERRLEELSVLNRAFDGLLNAPRTPFRTVSGQIIEYETELRENSRLLRPLLPSFLAFYRATTRHTAMIRASLVVLAVRRADLLPERTGPFTAKQACRMAGLPGVPVDPYDGQPVRFVENKEARVVYCVGSDGVDDAGRIDWEMGQKPGDFLFPVPHSGRQ